MSVKFYFLGFVYILVGFVDISLYCFVPKEKARCYLNLI
jgi:hypothetical protein